MIKNFWQRLNNSVTGSALIITFFSVLSKVFGLVRERLIASSFGASEISDIYYSAFRLPDLIFNTLVLGALSSAFIPVFQKIWSKDKAEGIKLANSVLLLFLIIVSGLVILGWIFSAQLVAFFTPGFSASALNQANLLTRIMLLAIVVFVVSNVIGGVLNAWKRFFSFSLASIFYNIGIIIGILCYPYFGLMSLAWGVCLGALLHLLVQLPEAYKNGWHFKIYLKIDHSVKKILRLMLPRTLGLAASQVNLIVTTMIASTLASGSIAIFNMANNLQSLPVSIFAISLAVAVFPTLTEAVGANNSKLFAHNFTDSLRKILFLLVPISILILILRAQIVRVVLGAGAFNWEDTYYTAQALGLFAISIFAQGLIPLLARSFYAFEDTKTPMIVSAISIVINIILSVFLAKQWGVLGLALANSIASIINMICLYVLLSYYTSEINHRLILLSTTKIFLLSLIAGFISYCSLFAFAQIVDMRTFWGIFIQGVSAGLIGLLSYIILAMILKLDEIQIVRAVLNKFWLFLKNGKNS